MHSSPSARISQPSATTHDLINCTLGLEEMRLSSERGAFEVIVETFDPTRLTMEQNKKLHFALTQYFTDVPVFISDKPYIIKFTDPETHEEVETHLILKYGLIRVVENEEVYFAIVHQIKELTRNFTQYSLLGTLVPDRGLLTFLQNNALRLITTITMDPLQLAPEQNRFLHKCLIMGLMIQQKNFFPRGHNVLRLGDEIYVFFLTNALQYRRGHNSSSHSYEILPNYQRQTSGYFATPYISLGSLKLQFNGGLILKASKTIMLKQKMNEKFNDEKVDHIYQLCLRLPHLHFKPYEKILIKDAAYVVFFEKFFRGEELFATILKDRANNPHLTVKQRLEIMRESLYGLSAVHAANIVHKDIKPENIIQNRGKIKIIDFNLSKDASIILDAVPVGSVGYIAPEVYSLRSTYLSDIYSLGITLSLLFNAKLPKNCQDKILDQLFVGLHHEISTQHRATLHNILSKMTLPDPALRCELSWAIAEVERILLDINKTNLSMPEQKSLQLAHDTALMARQLLSVAPTLPHFNYSKCIEDALGEFPDSERNIEQFIEMLRIQALQKLPIKNVTRIVNEIDRITSSFHSKQTHFADLLGKLNDLIFHLTTEQFDAMKTLETEIAATLSSAAYFDRKLGALPLTLDNMAKYSKPEKLDKHIASLVVITTKLTRILDDARVKVGVAMQLSQHEPSSRAKHSLFMREIFSPNADAPTNPAASRKKPA